MTKQIRVTFNFSKDTNDIIKIHGKYAQIKQIFYKGNQRLVIEFSNESKSGYYKVAGNRSMKVKIDENILETMNIDPEEKYQLIPIDDIFGSFWLEIFLLQSSQFTGGKAATMNACINGYKKSESRRANVEDPDSTSHLINQDNDAYIRYCRGKQNEAFRIQYGRNPFPGRHRGHKISITYGLKNNIPKEIIADPQNMIEQTKIENLSLGINCLLTEDEFKKETGLDW